MNKLAVGVAALGLSVFATADPIPGYTTNHFRRLIAESYGITRTPGQGGFFKAMDSAATSKGNPGWIAVIKKGRLDLDRAGTKDRRKTVLQICERVHRLTKQALPTFTLDRGFEFANAANRGERQCLLQSVFVASLFREMNLQSGVAMVWKNDKGTISNMGHVCALVDLPGGQKAVVDCSDPTPFIEHKGLFMNVAGQGYRFVEPQYRSHMITQFKNLKSGKVQPASALQPLDFAYVRSQFAFYRGERFPNGILDPKATPRGLAKSENFFRTSLANNSLNPLSTWLLSQTLSKQGKKDLAWVQRNRAVSLYKEFGWIPPSLR